MMKDFFTLTYSTSYLLLITIIVLSLIKLKYINSNEKWYIYYIIFIFFVELFSFVLPLSYITEFTKIKDNSFLYPVYIAGEFFTITGIFIKKLKISPVFFVVTTLLSLYFLTADRMLVCFNYNNDYSKAISNIVMVCLIGYSLIQDIKKANNKNPFQLIDKMYFLYFTVSIFIFIFQQQLIEFPIQHFTAFWIINNLMVCVLYSLFIKTLLQLKK